MRALYPDPVNYITGVGLMGLLWSRYSTIPVWSVGDCQLYVVSDWSQLVTCPISLKTLSPIHPHTG